MRLAVSGVLRRQLERQPVGDHAEDDRIDLIGREPRVVLRIAAWISDEKVIVIGEHSLTVTSRLPPARNAAASFSACSAVTWRAVAPCRISTGALTLFAVVSG